MLLILKFDNLWCYKFVKLALFMLDYVYSNNRFPYYYLVSTSPKLLYRP